MDPDTGSLILAFTSLALGSLVVYCQNAIVDIPDNFLRHADPGTKNLTVVEKLLQSPRRFNSVMRVGYTFFHLSFAFLFAGYITQLPALAHLGGYGSLWQTVEMVLTLLLSTLLILIFSRGLPRRLAARLSTKGALAAAPMAYLFAVLFAPMRLLVDFFVGGLMALAGGDFQEGEDSVTEEEIRMLVDVGQETGGIERTEQEMINNIFEFDDRTADQIMTHRTDLVFVETDCTLMEIIELSTQHGFSRIPVVEDSIDNIVGILNVKDMLPLMLEAKDRRSFKVAKYMRQPLYVPESTRCKDLFTRLGSGQTQIAVVVDEYGGTSGIVTMEDLVESIVGNILDEYDNEEQEARELSADSYTLDGDIDLEDVEDLLGCDLDAYREDYETLGGLIIGMLDRIPDPGEHPSVVIDHVSFTVEQSSERQILKVLAVRGDFPAATGGGG